MRILRLSAGDPHGWIPFFVLWPGSVLRFFAFTAFLVFVAGILAPRLARRLRQVTAARVGTAVALTDGIALWASNSELSVYVAASGAFLMGMGVVNPLGTAIALNPFPAKADAASALLGSLQMSCAAIAITVAALLLLSAQSALGVVLTGSLGLAT